MSPSSRSSSPTTPRLGKQRDEDGYTQTPLLPQFRLSTLLLIILVASIPLSYWGVQRMRTRIQQDVLQQMAGWGPAAGWFEGNVVQITFRGERFGADAAPWLGKLPHLQRLVLIDTQVDADALRPLANLPLTELQIHGAPRLKWPENHASPEASLRFSPTLQSLGLEYTSLDDRAIVSLQPLAELRSLSLTGTPVSDACVPELAKLTQLESITLRKTKLTEAGVERLQRELPKAYIHWDESR